MATVITAVGTEEANRLPSEFVACTLKRMVLPTSTLLSRYPLLSRAPLMFAQLPPSWSQRTQKSL